MLPPSARLTAAELRAVFALLTRRVARMGVASDSAIGTATGTASATGTAAGLTLDQCDRETRIAALSETLADFLASDAATAALLRRLEACTADARQGYAAAAFLARVRARAARVDHEAAADALIEALIMAGVGGSLESLDVLFANETAFCAHFVKVYGDARPTTASGRQSNRDPDGCTVM